MDKTARFQELMHCLLQEYYEWHSQAKSNADTELVVICDDSNKHYQLLRLGWRGEDRVRSQIFYVRIKNQKLWIEEDWTEEGIAVELMRAGVSKEDIVLAFNPPMVRQYTEFAVA